VVHASPPEARSERAPQETVACKGIRAPEAGPAAARTEQRQPVTLSFYATPSEGIEIFCVRELIFVAQGL
jgi:hypothetical protein